MFNYSNKTKAILVSILIAIIIAIIVVVQYNNSRSKDLQIITQVQSLATSLEKYYDKFNAYPESIMVNINTINVITENGINKAGNEVYFKRDFDWAKSAIYASNKDNYVINFSLDNSWQAWDLDKGGNCQLITGMSMRCTED